jgi:peptidoglycan/LPS O-acetylase OafA/YrhL
VNRPHVPGLDGLRGLAVLGVLLFHSNALLRGGYLGVDLFFVLSGYLITGILLEERERTGTIDLRAFWTRRARRLMPALLATMPAIALYARFVATSAELPTLRADALATLAYVANWRAIFAQRSYWDLFLAASPLEHTWSLAIEEQFYVLWPLVVWVLSRRRLFGVSVALALASAVAMAMLYQDGNTTRVYLGTDTRGCAILVGAMLACAFDRARAWIPARAIDAASFVALAVLAFAWSRLDGQDPLLYRGGFWVTELAAAVLVFTCAARGDSPVARFFSLRPLRALGAISYGVYLYHWPIFVIMDEQRTGLDRPLLVPLQIVTTLVISQVSYLAVEQPIRRARRLPVPAAFGAGAIATAAVAVLAVTIVPKPLGEYWLAGDDAVEAAAIETVDGELAPLTPLATAPAATPPPTTVAPPSPPSPSTVGDAAASTPTSTTTSTVPPATTEPPLPSLPRPVRIVVAGDSTAGATGAGLIYWANDHPQVAQVEVVGAPGCGFLLGGERRDIVFRAAPEGCAPYVGAELPRRVAEVQPDVVMMMVTTWDIVDHKWEDGVERGPTDPLFRERLQADYAAITDELLAAGAGSVAWVKPPIPNILWQDLGTGQEEPVRHEVLGEVLDTIAGQRPGEVAVVDLRAWLEESGRAEIREVRPDGVHFDPVHAVAVADEWLGERLIRIALGL